MSNRTEAPLPLVGDSWIVSIHGSGNVCGDGSMGVLNALQPDPPTPTNVHTRMMETLNLPSYEFRTTEQEGKPHIYDSARKTYVRLTPEEWVRQHFVQYLIQELDVPAGLVATEAPFRYQDQPWRADIVVHDRQGDPLLLVECKAPSVPIGQDTFDQGARYNLVLDAPYLVVTNGQEHYACRVDTDSGWYSFLDGLPSYKALLNRSS